MNDQLTNHGVTVDGYAFSYISKNEFDSIFKHVKRERRKKHDEKLWERFLVKKQEKSAVSPHNQEKIFEEAVPTKEKSFEVIDAENVKFLKQPAAMNQLITKDSIRQGYQRTQEVRQVAETTQSPDCQDCACVGHHGSINERSSLKKASRENNLFEITNFDEEFKRVEELRDKIVFALKSIENALIQEGYKNLDEDDLLRNRMRTSEFAARFKRNYHYQITRQVNEIKKLNSNESWKKTSIPTAVKKFKSSHQVAAQGLQAVEKHLRTTCDNSAHPWLQEFLSSICEMENLFSCVFECENNEDQMALRTVCSAITVQLNSIISKHRKEPEVKRKKKKHVVKRSDAKDNLWMYRTHKDWKAKASELARVKLAKMNKKKVEASERPDEQPLPPPVPDHLPDLKMEVKQREGAVLRKHVRSMKEDQVRTMMEIVPDATDSDREEENAEVEEYPNPSPSITKNQDQQPVQVSKPRTEFPSTEVPAQRTNVGYICLSRDEEDSPIKSGRSQTPQLSKPNMQMATQYRKALQSYQRKMKWYNPNVISSIDRMTDQIYEEQLSTVASEINIDHIISNLIDLEMRS